MLLLEEITTHLKVIMAAEAVGGQNEMATDDVSKFSHMYKIKGSGESIQTIRRREVLERQKRKRFDSMNHMRKLIENIDDDDELDDSAAASSAMDTSEAKQKSRRGPIYKNQLMMSEWMIEKPEGFETDWLMIPVPIGRRNLVISSTGKTSCFAKSGVSVNRFPSHLPGGNRHKHKWNIETAILDCIYNDDKKTFYILDIMGWKMHPMYDAETEFRFYWLHEKFLEVPEVSTVTKMNKYRFEPLPALPCDAASIRNVLSCETDVPLDGLLFYHKKTVYTFGPTPLVLWLRPYMIPEVLQQVVPQKYVEQTPPNYKGIAAHAEMVRKNQQQDRERKHKQYLAKDKAKDKNSAENRMNIDPDFSKPLSFNFVAQGTLSSTSVTDAAETSSSQMDS